MNRSPRLLFVTGTDTGVGKTLLTALLLAHLRGAGVRALAMKPFCSGGRGDARLLHRLAEGEIAMDEVNPFFFAEPLAPLLCARRKGQSIRLPEVRHAILNLGGKCDLLLIEGAGGLCTPLGEGLTALDLIAQLQCEAVVVAPNRLGTINQTSLTVRALQHGTCVRDRGGKYRLEPGRIQVVLMEVGRPDQSAASNRLCITELLSPVRVHELPYLGPRACRTEAVKENAEKFHKMLARIAGGSSF